MRGDTEDLLVRKKVMSQTLQLWRELQLPSSEFTPIPFWFFNDMPDEERMRTQLEDYVEKGVNGIVLHPRIGVPEEIGYLSEEYFKAVRFLVKTAAELDMKIVLYDEGMYPSGSAHGMVVKKNPDFAAKGIRMMEEQELAQWLEQEGLSREAVQQKCADDTMFPRIITTLSNGRYLVYTFTKGTIRGIHFGEDDKQPGAPAAADILNGEAVDEFIRLTHERYYEELKEYFGNVIIAFFTDEPSPLGRCAGKFRPWLPGLEQEIIECGGKLEELEGLFTKENSTTTVIYHKLIKKHLREIFYRRLSQWCENHDIALMGHPEASDDVEEELYFHIPGQDLIMRRVSPETGGLREFDSVQAKLSADIARHLGRRRNANECFGVCFRDKIPWYFKAADMKWYIDWLGIRGVNLFVPHAFYYSVDGKRKEERPPDVGPHNIWWRHYRRFSDYMKRLSYLMTDSVNSAKVAVLCDNNRVPYEEVAVLFENQVEFNYLPVALLSECRMKEGRLCIREYEYEAVLNVTDAAWDEKVGQCNVMSGTGDNCVHIYHDAKVLVADSKLPGSSLASVHTSEPCRDLRVSGLHKYSTQMYLFCNGGQKRLETDVTVSVNVDAAQEQNIVTPVWVDLWRGEAKLMESTETKATTNAGSNSATITWKISLQPRETVLVMLDTEGRLAGLLAAEEDVVEECSRIGGRCLKERNLGDFTERFNLVEKRDNRAVYTLNYMAESVTGTEYFTVQAEEMVECYCNGEMADVAFWAPYRIRVGSLLEEGKNELELVVTGNAANVYCDAEIPFGLV